ncbi:MAG TPA: acyl-CoA thioesterase domain-containing protein [Acidimicrobiia bacterium]|jgi:acyl-coenzyme A thioesterase PaaI-like protein
MAGSQQDVSRVVVQSVHEFLGGPTPEGDEWRFEFGAHLNSNWGAVYGGALAAGALAVARSIAPERSPRSMHIQMVRSVPSGRAFAAATVRHPGRSVATVEVDLYDTRRKLAAIALLTMVTPEAVAAEHDRSAATPPFRLIETPIGVDDELPGAVAAGIVATLGLNRRFAARNTLPRAENFRQSVDGSAASAMECTVPWDDLEHAGPEAACLIADSAVAMPILNSYIPVENIGPNPDLTLRFTTAPATRIIQAASNMLSVQDGTTTIGIEVQAGDNQLAHGLATSLLLRPS